MVPVSKGWVDAHKETLLPETFIELTYSATDPTLVDSAEVVGDTGEAYFSDPSDLINGEDRNQEKIGTLEHGVWGLDGTFVYLDGVPEDPGYVSGAISGGNCVFSTIPTITIAFASLQNTVIPGLTITWSPAYNEWATSYRVSAYNGSTVVAQMLVDNNESLSSTVELPMEGFTKITIEVLSWCLPYHRARCTDIFLGAETVYEKADLMGFEHTQSVDLLSAALPKNEIIFRLRNEDNRWNPDNPTGNEKYLQEQQEIRVRYGMMIDGEIEWIPGGTFWLTEWSTPANGMEATFTARDLFGFMNEEYTGIRSGTLYDIAVAALVQADLPTQDTGESRYAVDVSLKNYSTDFSGDQTYTISQVLQLVAHAGLCVMYQDREGVVRIEPRSTTFSGYEITQEVSYSHPEYEFTKPLKALSVSYGEDKKAVVSVSHRGEVQTIDNVLLREELDAIRVGEKAREILESRKTISGEFRADLSLDTLDQIVVHSKYASNVIAITDISFSTTGGAFRGSYTGRVVSVNLKTEEVYSGEIYSGEI